MLRGKTQPKQFDTKPGDFLDERWDVHKPPATENVQIPKLSRQDTEFVLDFAREDRAKEFIRRVRCTEVLQGSQVGHAGAIARQLYSGVYRALHARHKGKRQIEFAAMREHTFFDQLSTSLFAGIFEIGRQ